MGALGPFAIAAAGALAVDQASKWAILHLVDLPSRPCANGGLGCLDVIPPLLRFRMGWNEGINFGLLAGQPDMLRWVLIALAVGVSLWMAAWVRRDGRLVTALAAGLLAGGALGNALDRVVHGAVADFLHMSCCGIDNPFVFNIADIAIFAGAIALVFVPAPRKAA